MSNLKQRVVWMWTNTKVYTYKTWDFFYVIFLIVPLWNVNFVDDDILWQYQEVGSELHFNI